MAEFVRPFWPTLQMRKILRTTKVRWSIVSDRDHRCYMTTQNILDLWGKRGLDIALPHTIIGQRDADTGRAVFILRHRTDPHEKGTDSVRFQSDRKFLKTFDLLLEIQSKKFECIPVEAMDCTVGIDEDGDLIFWVPYLQFKDSFFLKQHKMSEAEMTALRPSDKELATKSNAVRKYWSDFAEYCARKDSRPARHGTSHMHTDDGPVPDRYLRKYTKKKEKT